MEENNRDLHWYSRRYKEQHNLKPLSSKDPHFFEKLSGTVEKVEEKTEEVLHNVEKEIKKDYKKVKKDIKKHWIIFGSIILIILIFIGIYFFTQPNEKTKLTPLDTIISNETSYSPILYENKAIFGLSGWEHKLTYSGTEDRLFGKESYKEIIFDESGTAYTVISTPDRILIEPLTTNPKKITKIGWFTNPDQINIHENEKSRKKTSYFQLIGGEDIQNAEIKYQFFKKKSYFSVQFSAQAENDSNLGDFAYGSILKNYNIYLTNGTILENDNKIDELNNSLDIVLKQGTDETKKISKDLVKAIPSEIDTSKKAVQRKGSTYTINDSEYQIFYNPDENLAIITFSPYTLYYKNSFYWNVYWIYVPHLGDGEYPPLYMIMVENPTLKYIEDESDWYMTSGEYSGFVNPYIDNVIFDIESGQAQKFNINDYNIFKK